MDTSNARQEKPSCHKRAASGTVNDLLTTWLMEGAPWPLQDLSYAELFIEIDPEILGCASKRRNSHSRLILFAVSRERGTNYIRSAFSYMR